MRWEVFDRNELSIKFYGSLGFKFLDEWRQASARTNPVLKETPLHGIARQLERNAKMFARFLKMAGTNLKFPQCCVVL